MSEAGTTTQPTSIQELTPKMRLEGVITRTELYGAFVNLGLEREGMIHISQLAPRRINKVTDVVKTGDKVTVWVTSVDATQGRIALTMIEPPAVEWSELAEGQVRKGRVVRVERYGAFVDLGAERPALLHVKEMGPYVRNPSEVVKENQEVEVRILSLNRAKRQIDVTLDLGDTPSADDLKDEQPFVSPMELAYRQAQEAARQRRGRDKGSARRYDRRDSQDDLEDIYRRTLEQGKR
jgi:ribosomal protein S1